ncbi:MAG: DUF4264 family protein [Bacillota bacterium]|nr:DUF4264 family protein [Bacillota bacterium]
MKEERIRELGRQSFTLTGEVHLLVTFLNKVLKERNLIFGLSKAEGEGRYTLTIYALGGEGGGEKG